MLFMPSSENAPLRELRGLRGALSCDGVSPAHDDSMVGFLSMDSTVHHFALSRLHHLHPPECAGFRRSRTATVEGQKMPLRELRGAPFHATGERSS